MPCGLSLLAQAETLDDESTIEARLRQLRRVLKCGVGGGERAGELRRIVAPQR